MGTSRSMLAMPNASAPRGRPSASSRTSSPSTDNRRMPGLHEGEDVGPAALGREDRRGPQREVGADTGRGLADQEDTRVGPDHRHRRFALACVAAPQLDPHTGFAVRCRQGGPGDLGGGLVDPATRFEGQPIAQPRREDVEQRGLVVRGELRRSPAHHVNPCHPWADQGHPEPVGGIEREDAVVREQHAGVARGPPRDGAVLRPIDDRLGGRPVVPRPQPIDDGSATGGRSHRAAPRAPVPRARLRPAPPRTPGPDRASRGRAPRRRRPRCRRTRTSRS